MRVGALIERQSTQARRLTQPSAPPLTQAIVRPLASSSAPPPQDGAARRTVVTTPLRDVEPLPIYNVPQIEADADNRPRYDRVEFFDAPPSTQSIEPADAASLPSYASLSNERFDKFQH